MQAFLLGSFITVTCVLASVGGMTLVRRFVKPDALKIDHDVTSALIAILGTLYAIVLGLVVVDALSHREQAELMESTEANALATVMHLCRTMPVAKRRPIMQAELDYCEAAVAREWDLLDKGTPPDSVTVKAFSELWQKAAGYEPTTNRETNLHNFLLSAMTDFSNARRYRIVTCRHGLPSLLWLILIVGGICTIIFTYFFSAARGRTQAVMTSIVALMLCLNVLLVYFYSTPYKGDLRIEPSALIHIRDLLRNAPVLQKKAAADDSGPNKSADAHPAAVESPAAEKPATDPATGRAQPDE
jgi:hypothetical protein